MRLSSTLILIGTLSVLALAGCTPGSDDPDETNSPSPQTSQSATPTESASAEPTPEGPTATLPIDCANIAPATILTPITADMELQTIEGELVRPHPAGATTALLCPWFNTGSDITGMDVIISSTTKTAAAETLPGLSTDGYACAPALDGTRCTLTTDIPQYESKNVETIFSRGDVWIYISASNVDDTGLLDGMVSTIWS